MYIHKINFDLGTTVSHNATIFYNDSIAEKG